MEKKPKRAKSHLAPKDKSQFAKFQVEGILESVSDSFVALDADAFVYKAAMSKSLVSVILELAKPTPNGTNSRETHDGNRETVIEKSGTQGSGSASSSSKRRSMIGMKKEPKA